jgi:hypothetical protein
MSLLVWLPLNGSLENKGLSLAKFNLYNHSGAISIGEQGKTTKNNYKRITPDASDYIGSDINFLLDKDFSMCCWCKLTGYSENIIANGIITQHGHLSGGSGITAKVVNGEKGKIDLRMSFNAGYDSTNRIYSHFYGETNIYN